MERRGMMDVLFVQALATIAFALAAGIVGALLHFTLKLVPLDAGTALVLAFPLFSLLLAETATGLWLRTPGTLGLGSLTIMAPALAAGAAATLASAAGHAFLEPLDREFPRDGAPLSAWVILALVTASLALALWRYWPEPRARLF